MHDWGIDRYRVLLICKRRNYWSNTEIEIVCGGSYWGFGAVARMQTMLVVVVVIVTVVVVLILVHLATYGGFGCGACSAGKLW